MASLNRIAEDIPVDTPVARSAGVTDETLGGTSSRTENAIPNSEAIGFPAWSRTPVVIVTTIPVAFGRIVAGTNSADDVVAS
jgi:hypothetical protein